MSNSDKKAKVFDIEEMMKMHQNRWKEDEDKKQEEDDKKDEKADKMVEDDDESDDDMVGPPLPPGFGDDDEEEDEIGPPMPPGTSRDSDAELSEDDDNNEDNRYSQLPTSHEIALKHGTKSVTALALDPNGARLVTGSIDYEVKFWDFQGMDNTLQSFRSTKPVAAHSIKHLEYSSNGELILVISGACIAKLLDRDGGNKGETQKGDQYLLDKAKTKGHVAALNSGCWHPMDRNIFVTTSGDTTARFWDVNKGLKEHKTLIKPRSAAGAFTSANCLAFTPVGDLLALGCADGSIQMWDTRRPFVNTTHQLRGAHQKQSDISSIRFSYNGYYLLSRGTDDETMKLWDVRAIRNGTVGRDKKTDAVPIHVWKGLENSNSNTDCFFSPDDRLAITGCSVDERESSKDSGSIRFFNVGSFEQESSIDFGLRNSVIRTFWHPKLNQIVASGSDGSLKMLYDLKRSSRGALLCSFRQKRKREADVFQLSKPTIITPNALPMFKEEKTKSKYVQFLKARKDPIASKQPQKPLEGAGAGGRIGAPGKSFVSFIAKNIGVKNKIDDTLDPREAILRHAKDAAENPYWIAPAYNSTQPKAIFQASTQDLGQMKNDDPEWEIDEEGNRKKRKHVPI